MSPRPSWIPRPPPLYPRPESGPHALIWARSGLPAGSRGCPGDDERRINGAQGRQRCFPAALPAGSHCHRAAAARCAALGVGARSGVGPGTSFHPPQLGVHCASARHRRGLAAALSSPARAQVGVYLGSEPRGCRLWTPVCRVSRALGATGQELLLGSVEVSGLRAACGGTWCPNCPPNCGFVPMFQLWTAMPGGLLPLNETLHHRSLARPRGGTGSKPNPVCRG